MSSKWRVMTKERTYNSLLPQYHQHMIESCASAAWITLNNSLLTSSQRLKHFKFSTTIELRNSSDPFAQHKPSKNSLEQMFLIKHWCTSSIVGVLRRWKVKMAFFLAASLVLLCKMSPRGCTRVHAWATTADARSDVYMLLTLGAQVICMPGTGRVVMYMVTQRYKYKVPMRKKNRLHAIDLQKEIISATMEWVQIYCVVFCQTST